MLIAIVAGKAAPGATTCAWALGLSWPRPILLIDADAAGGDMAAGFLAGRIRVDQGLLSWSAAGRREEGPGAVALLPEHTVALPEAPNLWFLSGLQNAGQGMSLDAAAWQRLAGALGYAWPVLQRDAIVDAGRLGSRSCWPVLRSADRVLLVAGRSLRSIHAASNAASLLRDRFGDLDSVSVLVTGPGPYGAAPIAGQVGTALAGELPDDRAAAMVLSDGALAGPLGLHRSRLLRSARTVAQRLSETGSATAAEAYPGMSVHAAGSV